jgi:hypothetical protein
MAYGPQITGLTALLLPGSPLLPPEDLVTTSDGWSLALSEASSEQQIDFPWTDLGPLGLPWTPNVFTDKAQDVTLPIVVSDSWGLVWHEDPVDLVIFDTWDVWNLQWSEAPGQIHVDQVFVPNDNYALRWLDVSSILKAGTILQDSADSWSLQFSESASSVSVAIPATDSWALSLSESSDIQQSGDTKNVTDTWSLFFANETATVVDVADIPILGSDQWALSWGDLAHITPSTPIIIGPRLVRIPFVRRIARPK